MKHEITSMRLKEAMNDVGLKQRELSEKADVAESSVSHYINGTHTPSNISAGKLARVLDVNPVWLMGFDAPKHNAVIEIDLTKLNATSYDRLKAYYDYLLSTQENDK